MARLALALCAFLLSALDAAAVTFSTTATQMCVGAPGCGVATQTIGGSVTISFQPVSGVTVAGSPPSNVSFGQVVVSCVGGGTACASMSLAGLNLYINIAQTVPSAGNGSLSGGVFTGSLSGTASSAVITWSTPNGINIGTVNYSILSNPAALVPPSTGGGSVTIVGRVASSASPALQGKTSRKVHTGAGTFDLTLTP